MGRLDYSTAVYFKTSRGSADCVVLQGAATLFPFIKLPNDQNELLGVFFLKVRHTELKSLEEVLFLFHNSIEKGIHYLK